MRNIIVLYFLPLKLFHNVSNSFPTKVYNFLYQALNVLRVKPRTTRIHGRETRKHGKLLKGRLTKLLVKLD